MGSKEYSRGKHPNSMANLDKGRGAGRNCVFDTPKTRRTISVTKESWENLKALAEETGCKSVSDFLEKASRGLLEFPSSAA